MIHRFHGIVNKKPRQGLYHISLFAVTSRLLEVHLHPRITGLTLEMSTLAKALLILTIARNSQNWLMLHY